MTLEFIDRNTYIHRPNFENKSVSNSSGVLKEVKVLTNNEESLSIVPAGAPIVSQPTDYSLLIEYVKRTPELISPIDALVKDEISGFEFEPIEDGSELRVKRAYEFAERNNLLDKLKKMDVDRYIYGNGFLVAGLVNETQIKSILNTNDYEVKDYELKELKDYVDELSYKNAIIQYLPATTVSIIVNDKFGRSVTYKQVVGLEHIDFTQDEVLHFKDLDYDGKLFGYSRIMSLKSEIQTIWNVKDYLGKYFDNNGTPDLLFIAPKLIPGSKQHLDFKEQLQNMKKMDHKRKNLLSTSEVKVERLNDLNTSMPFKDLIDKYTAINSMTYQVPATRIGVAGQGAGEGMNLTNQGYYRNVSSNQDYVENILNTQFFLPLLKVRLKLKRDYKEDELRQATINKSKLDVLEQMLRNNYIKREDAAKVALSYIGLDRLEIPTDEQLVDTQEQYMQGQKSKTDLLDEPQKKANKNKTPNQYK
jgi:phage portal protein BeeE